MRFFDKEAKALQKAKLANGRSRNELTSFLQEVIDRTSSEAIRKDFNRLKSAVEDFPACSDERAISLDKKIRAVVGRFQEQRFQFNNFIKGKDEESTMLADQYESANREIFELILPVIENQLSVRNNLMGSEERSKKEIKEMAAYERKAYDNRQRELAGLEDSWEIEGTMLEFAIRYRKLFHEQSILEQKHARLKQRGMTDKAHRDNIIAQLVQLDKEIAKIKERQSIVAEEMSRNEAMRSLMKDEDTELFVRDNKYGQEKFLKIFKERAGKVAALAEDRKSENRMFEELNKEYEEKRGRTVPAGGSEESDRYNAYFEELDSAADDGKLGGTVPEIMKEKNKL